MPILYYVRKKLYFHLYGVVLKNAKVQLFGEYENLLFSAISANVKPAGQVCPVASFRRAAACRARYPVSGCFSIHQFLVIRSSRFSMALATSTMAALSGAAFSSPIKTLTSSGFCRYSASALL